MLSCHASDVPDTSSVSSASRARYHTNSVVAKMYIFRREMSRMDASLNANFHPDVDFERARARAMSRNLHLMQKNLHLNASFLARLTSDPSF